MGLKYFGGLYSRQKMNDKKKPTLNKREIEMKFEEFLRKESKNNFYLRKNVRIFHPVYDWWHTLYVPNFRKF